MTIAFYMNIVSPHQMPLALEVRQIIGDANFRYIYDDDLPEERRQVGWTIYNEAWIIRRGDGEAKLWLENADFVLTGARDVALFALRDKVHKHTLYYSERWFKPRMGMLRLLSPKYYKMARAFFRLITRSDFLVYLPVGVYAAQDMVRLIAIMNWELICLFRRPALRFENMPLGRICGSYCADRNKCTLTKMRIWGYYVMSSQRAINPDQLYLQTNPQKIRVIWVGRLLRLKRVDTIIRAVGAHAKERRRKNLHTQITLDIYGVGPEEARLKRMAARYEDCIRFYAPVPIENVRELMREHDIYVLSSNAFEGWGAVVNEALEEGLCVLSSREAGAGATMLPNSNLFDAGDWRELKKKLEGPLMRGSIGAWSARSAAMAMVSFCKARINEAR